MDDGQGAFGKYGRPVMPEVYDRGEAMGLPLARAFGAGFVDPFGLTKKALGAFGYDHQARRLQEMQAEAPLLSEAGGLLLPGLGGLKAAGLTGREIASALPNALPMAYGIHELKDVFDAAPRPALRAQGSYPPRGAY
jgi:hypothetical protein